MLDQSFKYQWINALISGNYQQTKGCLRNDFGFCCLGVACDIKDNSSWVFDKSMKFYFHDNCFCTPSYRFQYDIGLEDYDMNVLVGMNEDGKSFTEIASYIKNI